MLNFPAEWRQQFGVQLVTAYPPQGGGRFRYFERLRPQPSFSAILDTLLATDPAFVVHELGEPQRIVTGEGEYGAWVQLVGRREGSRAMRYIGAVFLGEFAAALDCIVLLPDRFAEFERLSRQLLHGARFGLGRRPRQFYYRPPAGWGGIPSGLVANYYPDDFPRNLSTLVVPPATEIDAPSEAIIAAARGELAAGLLVESESQQAVSSDGGSAGLVLSLVGRRAAEQPRIYRDLALFIIPPYAYRLRLETLTEPQLGPLRAEFRAVVASFRPLPDVNERRLGQAFADLPLYFEHWAS